LSRKQVDLGKRGKGHRRRLWACDGQGRLQESWHWSFSSPFHPVLTLEPAGADLSDQLHQLPFLPSHMHTDSAQFQHACFLSERW